MGNRGILIIAAVMIAGYFLYEPVMDRFFTDTSLKVAESVLSSPEENPEVHLETPLLDLTFSPVGGRIISARLKGFTDDEHQPVELISDLLNTRAGVRLEIPGIMEDLDDRPYHARMGPQGITFTQKIIEGLEIRKAYRKTEGYGLQIELTFTNSGPGSISFPDGYRMIPFYGMQASDAKEAKKLRALWTGKEGESVEREKTKKIKQAKILEPPAAWIGLHNRYFTQTLVSLNPKHETTLYPLGEWQVYPVCSAPPLVLEPGQTHQASYLLYLGPMIEEELERSHEGLSRIVDYGTFEFLGKGVLFLLRWIHRTVANYGLCLILLAFLMRILLLPLTQYNLKSLREMPRVMEKIYAIEDEEKENPERSAERTRPLRKKQVQSMIGSFLPLAIQLPIFLALYQVLNGSLDLRQADFTLWITDLSVRDPYFILPALMGLAMILQQRLTVANPGEDKTWIWMPLGFALLFSFFPAGLVLFWLADTLFSAAQLSWIAARSGT